jgi:hypothetical protein
MRRDHPDSAWRHVVLGRVMRRRVRATRARVAAPIVGIFCVIHILSGCTLESEKPDLALDTPGKYRATHGASEADASVGGSTSETCHF